MITLNALPTSLHLTVVWNRIIFRKTLHGGLDGCWLDGTWSNRRWSWSHALVVLHPIQPLLHRTLFRLQKQLSSIDGHPWGHYVGCYGHLRRVPHPPGQSPYSTTWSQQLGVADGRHARPLSSLTRYRARVNRRCVHKHLSSNKRTPVGRDQRAVVAGNLSNWTYAPSSGSPLVYKIIPDH